MELKSSKVILKNLLLCLLIEPYGIEIGVGDDVGSGLVAFNRTLWN